MSNIITLFPRKVKARGLNKSVLPIENKVKEQFFTEDYENLKLLDNIKINLEKTNVRLLYPGCGCDILFPLLYLEKLFPNVQETKYIFVDVSNMLPTIKTILSDIGISFSENKNKISFYWKNILVDLVFVTKNIEDIFHQIKPIDIYFERAFRIMRERIDGYEEKVVKLLNSGGILISDSGFLGKKLQYIKVPKILSSYNEMVIGVKEIRKK